MSRSLDLLNDVCGGLPMTVRAMFGGHGFFAPNGGMFAGIVSDDEIIFKLADETAKAELVALGGRPWTYEGKHKPMVMASWIVVPEGFYDDPETLSEWARRSHRLAPGKGISTKKRPSSAARPKPKSKKVAPAKRKTALAAKRGR